MHYYMEISFKRQQIPEKRRRTSIKIYLKKIKIHSKINICIGLLHACSFASFLCLLLLCNKQKN